MDRLGRWIVVDTYGLEKARVRVRFLLSYGRTRLSKAPSLYVMSFTEPVMD